jgi:hypothetical protein
MRATLSIALLLLGASAAPAAEVWGAREGECGEWRARWNVNQEPDGVWTGVINHENIGGPCSRGTGEQVRTEVRAIISGSDFFAARRGEEGVCSYYGTLRGDRVRGFVLCENIPIRLAFALRFPEGETLETRQRQRPREQDEWLDDPRNTRRAPPSQGLRFDFQIGPAR